MGDHEIRVLRLVPEATIPNYAHVGDSGLDLCAIESATLAMGKRCVVRTGIAIEIPAGLEGQIRSRSGLAKDHGVIVFNSPGTIDSGYRGEILVLLANFGERDLAIHPGMRIAQLVFCRVESVSIHQATEFEPTPRGTRGLGSTGGYQPRDPQQRREE